MHTARSPSERCLKCATLTTIGDGNGKLTLPELQLIDPASGEYYSVSEWAEISRQNREQLRKKEAEQRREALLAKAKQNKPRWRILNDRLTAKVSKK